MLRALVLSGVLLSVFTPPAFGRMPAVERDSGMQEEIG